MSGQSSKGSGFWAKMTRAAFSDMTTSKNKSSKNKSSKTASPGPVASGSSSAAQNTQGPSTATASSSTMPATASPAPHFDKQIRKGKELYDLMARPSGVVDVNHDAVFDARYTIAATKTGKKRPPYSTSQSTTLGLPALKLPTGAEDDYEALQVDLRTDQSRIYTLSRHTAHGILSADGGDRKGKDDQGLPWSESAYQAFKYQATQAPAPASVPLRYLFQRNIANQDTVEIIEKFNAESRNEISFAPSDDGFYALLGCENGRGAAYLVKDHGVALGVRTVAKVTAFKYYGYWNMLMEFG